jgi:hypothetical protein
MTAQALALPPRFHLALKQAGTKISGAAALQGKAGVKAGAAEVRARLARRAVTAARTATAPRTAWPGAVSLFSSSATATLLVGGCPRPDCKPEVPRMSSPAIPVYI